jgi:hypothetical protein
MDKSLYFQQVTCSIKGLDSPLQHRYLGASTVMNCIVEDDEFEITIMGHRPSIGGIALRGG